MKITIDCPSGILGMFINFVTYTPDGMEMGVKPIPASELKDGEEIKLLTKKEIEGE